MAAKTVNEMKADIEQATLATWIQLVQEKGYEKHRRQRYHRYNDAQESRIIQSAS